MIVITNIDTIEVDREYYELDPYRHQKMPVLLNDQKTYMDTSYVVEQIRGRKFRRPDSGAEIIIGASKQAQDIIGIQIEAWEAMEIERDHFYSLAIQRKKENNDMFIQWTGSLKSLGNIFNAPFLTRLKWLFTGVKV